MSQSFVEQLSLLVRARYSLLYIVTWEERRARRLIARMAQGQQKELFEWSITSGLRQTQGPQGDSGGRDSARKVLTVLNKILQAEAPGIYVLRDFHAYFEAPEVIRQMRDLADALRYTKKTVIILSPVLKVPPELDKQITVIDLPLPGYDDLKALLDEKLDSRGGTRKFRVSLSDEEKDALIRAAQGLTLAEAENAFAKAIVRDTALHGEDIETIIEEKRQVIRKTGLLEYYDATENMSDVGGMDLLKDWLGKRYRAFSIEARNYGLPEPRGALLLGVQGCGKSLVAKTVAATWRFPLLRLDMSRIFQGYIGSSEQNMRQALHMAETLAPVVLWVDEIEKAFSGIEGSGSSDAGTTARVAGSFLTWLQEKKAAVFVVATANDIKGLPPELLRKGRLDEIFFVDLPDERDRREIFAIHLRKVRRDPKAYDLTRVARAADGFSGAEIEQAVVSGLHDSFFETRQLETRDILGAIQDTVPMSQTMRERIHELREWARDRARPVSSRPRTQRQG